MTHINLWEVSMKTTIYSLVLMVLSVSVAFANEVSESNSNEVETVRIVREVR